jgi:hypothetical protein
VMDGVGVSYQRQKRGEEEETILDTGRK